MSARVPKPEELAARMPKLRDSARRALCRLALRATGWGLGGEFPDVARLVLIVAPHSSWWDGFWGLLVKVAVGADVRFMGKQELFHGPLGGILHALGGMPVDRNATKGVVEQMIEAFNRRDALWLRFLAYCARRRRADSASGVSLSDQDYRHRYAAAHQRRYGRGHDPPARVLCTIQRQASQRVILL